MNRKKLVDLLAEKTGLNKAEVEDQLTFLMDELKSELAKGGEFKAPGLGRFSMKGDDIVFRAESKLSTEVNFKYAGMKPIELIGAYKEASDLVAGNKAKKETGTEPVPGVEEYTEEMAAESDEEQPEIEETTEQEQKKPKKKEAEESPISSVETEKDEVSETETPEKLAPEKEKPASAAKPKAAATAPAEKKYRPKRKKETDDSLGKILVAAVIIIAVGISGWMFYDLGYFGGSAENENGSTVSESSVGQNLSTIPQQQSDNGGNKTAADTVTNGETTGTDNISEQDESNSTSSITSIAESSRQSVYGLRGGASPNVEDGYTIVVHSLRDEAKVRRLNEELQQKGYRTVISRASIMDTTFWRLGLGRFKTIDDAQNASQTLPDPYKSNHFIKRIQ